MSVESQETIEGLPVADPIYFSHFYPKLTMPIFPTIRRIDKYVPGRIYEIFLRENYKKMRLRYAKCIGKFAANLLNIPVKFLLFDTNTETREMAVKLINSFYQHPIQNHEKMTVIFLEWI